MKNLIRTTLSKLPREPDSGILKAEDYANYVKADDVLQKAQQQAEHIHEKATQSYNASFNEGYQEGLKKADAELAERIVGVMAKTKHYIEGVEHDLVDVVLSAVRKFVNEVDDETLVVNSVTNGLQLLGNNQRVLIRVAPSMIARTKERLSAQLSVSGYIDVLPDNRLGERDCILESGIGIINASIDRQLETIERVLHEAFDKH